MARYASLFVGLYVLAQAAAAQQAEIWLQPDTVYYQKRAYFYVRVMVDEHLTGAKVFHFDFTFDPAVAVVPPDSVRLGSFFAGIEEDTITVMYTNLLPDSTHLQVDIACLRDSAVLYGPGELLILPVKPIGFGETDITLSNVLIFDRFNQPIPTLVLNPTYVRICQFVGDVNADNAIDIADIVYMVEYMFEGGPAPIPSVWSANFNCDASPLDIADLVDYVTWAFQGGPWLCTPPCAEEH